ncbi:hypothetical protein [Corynebacterium macginleyi]|uniref:hypothetical protein n=1 Tax=Corynebacterium macginleyi TaxID=38290 RepID=UPI001EE4D83F
MRKRKIALTITVTIMSAALLLMIGPRRIAVATTETGDAELATTLRKNAEAGFNNLTAFTLHEGKATFAGLGADEHTEVENRFCDQDVHRRISSPACGRRKDKP